MKNPFKIYFYHSLIAFLPLLLMACDDKLDIAPEEIIVESEVFSDAKTAEAALGGAYYELYQATIGDSYMYGDITTDIIEVNPPTYQSYINADFTPDDGTIQSWWDNYYSTINLANNMITKIDQLGQYNEALERQHISEAKFIRAFCYLNLLKLFGDGALTGNMNGLGVPLQLTPFDGTDVDVYIPRSNNRDVYDQIIKDLKEAITGLAETYNNQLATSSRATVGSAYALLSRIYLYMGEYGLAAEAAESVLNSSVYSLTQNLRVLFPPNYAGSEVTLTTEHIFNIPVSANGSQATNSTNIGVNNIFYNFTNFVWASDNFLQSFEEGDNRKLELIFAGFDNSGNIIDGFDSNGDVADDDNGFPMKLKTFKFNSPSSRDNIPIIRLAEVMLTRAEALAKVNGLNQESIDLLNTVRQRAIPNANLLVLSDFVSADELIDRILKERKVELAFESLYRYDLIRTGRSLKNPNLPVNKLVVPIPQSEIDITNGTIVQNPGYL